MPKKKATKPQPKPALAAAADLPEPEHVPKERVGEVVQDFIDFGGVTTVIAQEENATTWLVRATA